MATDKESAHIHEATKTLNIPSIKLRLQQATHWYCVAKKFNHKSCLHFIETFHPKHWECILQSEEQQRLGHIAKSITSKLKGGGMSLIHHPLHCNGTETLVACELG